MVIERLYRLVCHQSGMSLLSSCFNWKKLHQPGRRESSPHSWLLAAACTCACAAALPPSGATLIEFETQSMLQSNCIVNQCLSKPRQRSGPSSRCAARDVQWCNLLLVRLHCSDHPLGRSRGVLTTFILMQTWGTNVRLWLQNTHLKNTRYFSFDFITLDALFCHVKISSIKNHVVG